MKYLLLSMIAALLFASLLKTSRPAVADAPAAVLASQPASQPAEAAWGETKSGFRIRLKMNKQTFDPMEAVLPEVEIQNLSGKDILVGSDGHYSYIVEGPDNFSGPDGRICPKTRWGLIGGFRSRLVDVSTFKAGTTIPEKGMFLNRAYDMTLDGQYTVTAHRNITDPSDPSKFIDLVSNTETISIGDNLKKKK